MDELRACFEAAMADLGPFEDHPFIGVAVSGGPDSMVLAALARDWTVERGGKLHAILIDHRLRPGSGDEIDCAKSQLEARGITTSVGVWEGPKPRSALQEQARNTRYRLIESETRKRGILHLLVGHHLDDQIETISMRRLRQPESLGLSGMTSCRIVGHMRVLRPLLGVRKEMLIEAARKLGLNAATDPSNLSPAFERGRMRLDPPDQKSRSAIITLGREMGKRRAQSSLDVGESIAAYVKMDQRGSITIDRAAVGNLPQDHVTGLIKKCLTTVRGVTTGPALRSADEIAAKLRELASCRLTLGGCIVQIESEHVRLCREPGRITDRRNGPQASALLWDKRYRIELADELREFELRPFGLSPGASSFEAYLKGGLPALYDGDDVIALLDPKAPQHNATIVFAPSRVLVEQPFVP